MKRLIILLFALVAMVADAQEIATWEGFRKGAASFTFDAGAPSHIVDVGPMFEKYGYRATFYLVCNWNPDWIGFQGLADNGHEIGSNSKSHGMGMEGEEASSKAYLNSKITQEYGVLTAAYPNGNPPTDPTAMQENYIAGRLVTGDVMGKDGPTDWYKLPAIITGVTGSIQRAVDFTSKMQEAINKSGWVVFITHGLSGRNNGNATYSPTDPAALDGALKWANYNDYIWIAPLRSVVMYIRERKSSTFKEVGSTSNTRTYTLTHSIANEVCQFNYPLSLCVPLPDGWGDVKVMQAGMELESEIKEDGKVYFKAVPNGGDIVMSETIHHNHNYTTWNYDAYTHWHVCTSTEGYCNAPKADEAAHSFGTGYICTVCGYEIPLVNYNIYVASTQVTSRNMYDVLGDGKVSYNPASNTLTLNGANIQAKSGIHGYGIQAEEDNMKIKLLGYNTITTTNRNGIRIKGTPNSGPITLLGGGLLFITSSTAGFLSYNDVILTDGVKIIVENIGTSSGGFDGMKQSTSASFPTLTMSGTGTVLRAKGGPNGSVHNFHALNLLDGIKIFEPEGATFVEDEGIKKNGAMVANEWVTIGNKDFIDGVNNPNANLNLNEGMFNLAGQRVDSKYKGVVIKGGKKVLIK